MVTSQEDDVLPLSRTLSTFKYECVGDCETAMKIERCQ
jgi:hypothetical protein